MRKLIEVEGESLVECDAPGCNFKVPVKNPNDPWEGLEEYINSPCPKCGANLLTKKDYDDAMYLLKTINWANRWLSWLTIFGFGKRKKSNSVDVKVYNGIHIK